MAACAVKAAAIGPLGCPLAQRDWLCCLMNEPRIAQPYGDGTETLHV